jgi:serine/threonine protein kinase
MAGTTLPLTPDGMKGRVLGKYEVLCRLSTGGMAEIFLASQRGLAGFRKLVVLKQILPDIRGEEEFVRMFLDEAKVTAAFNHPHIAQVYDLDVADGELFLSMEFVPGATLVEVARAARNVSEPIPMGFSLMAVRDTAVALNYAHAFTDPLGRPSPVIHRDVAEKNIMVTYEGVTKLLDFGIAKSLARASRTAVGMVKGTSGYMSPEQILGEPLDARSDLFSLGVVLHECLTGMRLFYAKQADAMMNAVLKADVPPPSRINKDVPPELDAIVLKSLARKREDRYATTLEFARAIERAVGPRIWHPEQSRELMHRLFADRREQTRQLLVAGQESDSTGVTSVAQVLAMGSVETPEPVSSSGRPLLTPALPSRSSTTVPTVKPPTPQAKTPPPTPAPPATQAKAPAPQPQPAPPAKAAPQPVTQVKAPPPQPVTQVKAPAPQPSPRVGSTPTPPATPAVDASLRRAVLAPPPQRRATHSAVETARPPPPPPEETDAALLPPESLARTQPNLAPLPPPVTQRTQSGGRPEGERSPAPMPRTPTREQATAPEAARVPDEPPRPRAPRTATEALRAVSVQDAPEARTTVARMPVAPVEPTPEQTETGAGSPRRPPTRRRTLALPLPPPPPPVFTEDDEDDDAQRVTLTTRPAQLGIDTESSALGEDDSHENTLRGIRAFRPPPESGSGRGWLAVVGILVGVVGLGAGAVMLGLDGGRVAALWAPPPAPAQVGEGTRLLPPARAVATKQAPSGSDSTAPEAVRTPVDARPLEPAPDPTATVAVAPTAAQPTAGGEPPSEKTDVAPAEPPAPVAAAQEAPAAETPAAEAPTPKKSRAPAKRAVTARKAAPAEGETAAPAEADGFLTLVTDPSATVYVAGRLLGDTPLFKVALPAGNQSLKLVDGSGRALKLSVEIKPGDTTSVRVPLGMLGRQ